MSLQEVLFVGGGEGPMEGWHMVPLDLQSYLAYAHPEQPKYFTPDISSVGPIDDRQLIRYDRRTFGGHGITGATNDLVMIDGWLIPWGAIKRSVFVRAGYEPTVQTVAFETFVRTPHVRVEGPWRKS